jgi:hypothetical protein
MIRISVGRSLAAMGLSSLLAAWAPVAQAAAVSGQGTWETTLQGRDLDGNLGNGFEAFYDTTQNLTWLADANMAATSGASATGLLSGASPMDGAPNSAVTARSFASSADLYGISDWTLPDLSLGLQSAYETCSTPYTCTYTPSGINPVLPGSSQLQHLMEVTLGNRSSINGGYAIENTGPFKNLQSGLYWSSEFRFGYQYSATGGFDGWTYDTALGVHAQQNLGLKKGHAWLVRAGDVAAVPEPQTVAMWALGLLALMGVVSRQKVAAPR